MGRKSKRNIIDFKNNTSQKSSSSYEEYSGEKIPTAIYARLSVLRDDDKSESIENQISLIHRYILDHPEMELFDVYADRDRSGTNFNRPEFERLISDVTKGKVTCIIVKDLSRFGRNYIETGVFIENIFPKLGARLIALNDNFDSSREEDVNSLSVPIKNMINEMYAKDISRKIISSNRIRNRSGDSKLRGNAPYGYKYEDNKLVPDERYAPYVRLIFEWRSKGISVNDIAKRLTLIGAPVPGNVTGDKNIDKFGERWLPSKIYHILSNPEYTGDSYRGRYEVNKFGGYSRLASEKKWLVYPDTHEALVSKDDFMKLNDQRKEIKMIMNDEIDKNTKSREKLPSDFPGLIFCAQCNRAMSIRRDKLGGSDINYTHSFYACSPKEGLKHCNNKISVDYLKMITMEQIKNQIIVMCDRANYFKEKRSNSGKAGGLYIDSQICDLEKELAEAKEKNAKLYEDYASGQIDLEDYRMLKDKISEDDISLKHKLDDLYKQKNSQLNEIDKYINSADEFEKMIELGSDKEIIIAMVKRVKVTKDGRLEIIFKHEDIYSELYKYLECE
ncbi:MAG: recombinase family protein [Eubacterium sp.]|nr:recombinase family protein [Eubacterium sp.]